MKMLAVVVGKLSMPIHVQPASAKTSILGRLDTENVKSWILMEIRL
jgi:hypothetical protein